MARFGKYEVLGVLGRGGMAEVLKCELTGMGGFRKTFAVKRVHPSRASEPRFVDMLLDEARLAATLNHANIVQVHEIDQTGDTPYIVMEYVDGPTLNQLIRRAKKLDKWEVPHFLRILSGICLGLHHAHKATDADGKPLNIIHRDVSPQNIIVARDGTAKLIDFGIAQGDDRLSETGVGVLKGKVAYMAPEQAMGAALTPVADIFSMGCLLYQCATRKHPFPGDSAAAVLRALTVGDYVAPSVAAPVACPPELGQLIESALVAAPDARCPSARALHTWIESYLTSIGYPTGTAPVASWLQQLYPHGEYADSLEPAPPDLWTPSGGGGPAAASRVTPPPPSSPRATGPSLSASAIAIAADSSLPMASYMVVRQRSPLFWVFTGLLSLAVVAAIVAVLIAPERFGLGAAANDTPAPAVTVPVDVAPRDHAPQTLATYLDEIEALMAERKHGLALDLLAKARALEVSDAALNIRRARVGDAAEIASFTALAQSELEAGDLEQAIAHAKAVLDRDFDNAAARTLLADARARTAAVAEAPKGPADAAPAPTGALVIAGTAGALVVVDDEPLGKAPLTLSALAAGEHRVELRKQGHAPLERTVTLIAGQTVHERFELQRDETTAKSSATLFREAELRRRDAAVASGATPASAAAAGRSPAATAAHEAGAAGTARVEGGATAEPAGAVPAALPAPKLTDAVAIAGADAATRPTALAVAPTAAPLPGATAASAPAPVAAADAHPAAKTAPSTAAAPATTVPATPAPATAPSVPEREDAPASAPQPVAAPALPDVVRVQSVREVVALFQRVEGEAMRRGAADAGQVRNSTAPLAKRLIDAFSPGQPLQLYPSGMYYKIVRMAQIGKSRDAIAAALIRGHQSGALKSYR